MTQDQFLSILGKRIAHGLNPDGAPRNEHYERMLLISMTLRVKEACPLVSFRKILRMAFLNKYLVQPRKDQMKAVMDFYPLLMATMDGHKLPFDSSLNLKQNNIMESFTERNALIEKALDVDQPLTKDEMKEVYNYATDEAKAAIRERQRMEKTVKTMKKKMKEEEEKALRTAAATELREKLANSPSSVAEEKINEQKKKLTAYEKAAEQMKERREQLSAYEAAVKKQKRSKGADSETRSKVHAELEEKIHQLYIKRHGEDTDKIPVNEYRLLQAIVHRDTEEQKRQEERDRAERLRLLKEEAVMTVCHQVRLHLNNEQKAYLQKCFGIARFCFNWAYDEWMKARERGERPFASDIQAQFMAINKEQYPWTYEVTHYAKQTGFKAFEKAVNAFFNGNGFPQRKRRKLGTGSLQYVVTGERKDPPLLDFNPDIPNSQPSKKRQYLFVPGLGYVKMMEKKRFEGLLTSVTIRLKADGHYYASLLIHLPPGEWENKHHYHGIVINKPTGIDLGVKDLAILSNGLCIDKRPEDERLHRRKKELQKAIYHRHELHPDRTSNTERRLRWQLGKVNARIGRQRTDYIHKVTSALAYTFNNICMENLNVADMIKDGKAASGRILDAGFYRFRELMEEKMAAAGHELHVADKFFPSTRTCSQCGCVQEPMSLDQRKFVCPDCGLTIDRDLNAAINLAKLIGLDEPNFRAADKGAIAAILLMSGVTTHQATEEKQVGHVT